MIRSMFHIAALDFIGGFENRSAARKIAKTRKAEDEKAKNSDERVLNKNASSTEESSKEVKEVKENKKAKDNKKESKKENVQADMANPNMHIKDKNPNVIDLGFGVKINTDIDTSEKSVIPNPAAGFVQPQPAMNPMQPNPAMVQPQMPMNPMVQQQMMHQEVNPMKQNPAVTAYDNVYLDYLQKQQQAAAIAVGKGNHKVDNPQPPKPPVIKSEKDDVNVNLDAIKIDTNPPKPKKEWPNGVCTPVVPNPEQPVVEEQIPVFDNSLLKNKYRYLSDIEKIALENNVQVNFIERLGFDKKPNGLIDVMSFTGKSIPNAYKCFTIDTGCLYDKRAKVFPKVISCGYEILNAYPVLIPKKEDAKGKSKSKNEINAQLFTDIFKGGVQMLDKVRGMYSDELMELNRNVALITMPTKNMDADTRKKVRDRLFAALNSGVFKAARDIEPNARFMFKNYDKKTGTFTLTNLGVPRFFGKWCESKNIVEINFGIDQTTVNKIS